MQAEDSVILGHRYRVPDQMQIHTPLEFHGQPNMARREQCVVLCASTPTAAFK